MMWELVFGLACAVQLGYWGMLHAGFRRARQQAPDAAASPPPASVVVAARNEARSIVELLDALACQTHPRFEVLVVDDASTDATPRLVREHAARATNVRLVSIETPVPPRKKHALTRGIGAATHDLLALTDADCAPPPGWLAGLAGTHAAFRNGRAAPEEIVLVGYSPFRRAPGLLNRLARYETFVTGFLTAAAIGLDRPYMAVGRNLAYSRTLFRRIDGFAHSVHSLSGDDDLLIQEVARRRAAIVRHVFAPETFVPTDAPPTWRAWLRQKRRHTSAGRFYARGIAAHLAAFQITGIALWLAPLLAGWTGLALLALRLIAQGVALREAARVFREDDLFAAFPFLDLLYAAYNAFVAPLGLLRMPDRW